MKSARMLTTFILALSLAVCLAPAGRAGPMGTAFTYQGRLMDTNSPADGLFDFQFKLYDSVSDGNQTGGDVNKPQVDVIDGYFTVLLDFNDPCAFTGEARWLEIGVRPGEENDPCEYTPLVPRQEVTPTPYALYAESSGRDNDWAVSGNDMYSIPGGNVGIGTTNPGYKLTIKGSGNEVYSVISEDGTANVDNLKIQIAPGGGTSTSRIGYLFGTFGNAQSGFLVGNLRNAPLRFGVGSGPTERMRIGANGNVGIGTPSPGEKLEVNGNIKMNSGYAIGYPSSGRKIVVGYHDFGLVSDGVRLWVPIPHGLSSVDQIVISLDKCSTTGFQVQPSGVQCCRFVSEGVWHQLVENKSGGSRYITTRWMAIGTP